MALLKPRDWSQRQWWAVLLVVLLVGTVAWRVHINETLPSPSSVLTAPEAATDELGQSPVLLLSKLWAVHHTACNLVYWIDGVAVLQASHLAAETGSTVELVLYERTPQPQADLYFVFFGPTRTAGLATYHVPDASRATRYPASTAPTAAFTIRVAVPPVPGNYTLGVYLQFCASDDLELVSQSHPDAVERFNKQFVGSGANATLVELPVVVARPTTEKVGSCTPHSILNGEGGYWRAAPAPAGSGFMDWTPRGCEAVAYALKPRPEEVWKALKGRRVLFLGDSMMRSVLLALIDASTNYSLPANEIGNEVCRAQPNSTHRLTFGAANSEAGPNTVTLVCQNHEHISLVAHDLGPSGGELAYISAPNANLGPVRLLDSIFASTEVPHFTDIVVNFGLHDVNRGVADGISAREVRVVMDGVRRHFSASRILWLELWAASGLKKPYVHKWTASHTVCERLRSETTSELERAGVRQLRLYDMTLAAMHENMDGVHYSIKVTRPIAFLITYQLFRSPLA